MPGTITSNQGGLAASLMASSQVTGDAGHALDGGAVPPGNGHAQANVDTRTGAANPQRLNVEPRHVADGSARASAALACGGAPAFRPSGNWLARFKLGKARSAGAAAAHMQAAKTDTEHARAADSPEAMYLAREAGIKRKVTVKIYWNPQRQAASRQLASSAVRPASRQSAMPALTEKLASQVAAHMQGHAGRNAKAYLAALAAQQRQCGESALDELIGMLGGPPAQLPAASGAQAELGVARRATEAWLLADYLQNEGRRDHGVRADNDALSGQSDQSKKGGGPLFISRLNQHVDGVLDTLEPEALWSLYRRVTVDSAITVPPDSSTLAGQTGTFFNAVGMSAARGAWAAARICALVEKPLSPQDLGRVLRNAVATHKPDAAHDETALMSVAEDITRLTTERAQYLLMRQLRLRAGKMLRDKGIPINELIGIATTVLPEAHYVKNVVGTLRRTLASGPFRPDGRTARHPSDDEIRQRLAGALDRFSDAELRAAAGNLLSERARHMKRLVQDQGEQPADGAALGRQFTILCEVLGEKLAERLGDASGLSVGRSLRGWDWDARLSRDTKALQPGGFTRARHTVYRGLQRLFSSVFPSAKSDQQRIREAYAEVVQAASGFIDAIDRNRMRDTKAELDAVRLDVKKARLLKQASALQGWTPNALRLFNESGARLVQAADRYEALCRSPAGKIARAELRLPGNSVQLFEAAFTDVMAKTPGARVNALGATVFDAGWLEALRGLHEIKHQAFQAGPRPAQSLLGRLFHRVHEPWKPPLGMAEAQSLLFALRNALGKEAGIRASAEILRALGQDRAGRAADGSIVTRGGGAADEADLRMLDDVRTLEQRFRPLDREVLPTPAQPGVDSALDRFIGMGMKRLSPSERGMVEAAVFNLDHRVPAWLEQDEVWQAVARYCQKASPVRTGAPPLVARRDNGPASAVQEAG